MLLAFLLMDKLIIDKLIGYIRPSTYLVLFLIPEDHLIGKIAQVEADDVNEAAYKIWTKHEVWKEIIENLLHEVIQDNQDKFEQVNSLIKGMSWHKGTWNYSLHDWQGCDYCIDLYKNPKEFIQPEIGQLVDFCLDKGFIDPTKLYKILTYNYQFFKIE